MTPPANTVNAISEFKISLARIEEKLTQLLEVKDTVGDLAKSSAQNHEEYIKEHAVIVQRTDRAHARIDALEASVEKLAKDVGEIAKFVPTVRALAWVAGMLVGAIVLGGAAWLWQLITHGGLILP